MGLNTGWVMRLTGASYRRVHYWAWHMKGQRPGSGYHWTWTPREVLACLVFMRSNVLLRGEGPNRGSPKGLAWDLSLMVLHASRVHAYLVVNGAEGDPAWLTEREHVPLWIEQAAGAFLVLPVGRWQEEVRDALASYGLGAEEV